MLNLFRFFSTLKNSLNLRPIKIRSSALTDTGRKRDHNEDSILSDTENNLFIVADGIGGHSKGEYASTESIKIVKDFLFSTEIENLEAHEKLAQVDFEDANDIESEQFPEINQLLHAIELANKKIFAENQDLIAEKKKGMGTTFVGCWFLPRYKKVILFNVGDSRIYLVREQELIQKTLDHSLLQYWLDHGQKGPKPNANIIVRAIGPRESAVPDVELMSYEKGDCWLICSDGLHGMLSDEKISDFILPRIKNNKLTGYKDFSKQMVEQANNAGGVDNISVILVHND